ncbi:MAG TPA: DUF554 domain-containing protein [Bellilinea sp.]|nr:DUF554 domain-containing protein [Bellilinea sp.]
MTGTVINVVGIILGSLVGVLFGKRLSVHTQQAVLSVLGLFTVALGIKMFLETQNAIIVLLSLLIGFFIGEALRIEDGLEKLGISLQRLAAINGSTQHSARFVEGFVVASLMFCIGPIAILGSIQDGLTGDIQTLVIKSIMDTFAAFAFATTLGIGVLFSAIPVLVYQGIITLLASSVSAYLTEPMILELTATGGVLLLSLAFSTLLGIKKIRTGNLLPALILAPILVLIFSWFGL